MLAHIDSIPNSGQDTKMKNQICEEQAQVQGVVIVVVDRHSPAREDSHTEHDLDRDYEQALVVVVALSLREQPMLLLKFCPESIESS